MNLRRKLFTDITGLLVVVCVICLAGSCNEDVKRITISPKEIDSSLVNPGRGFATTGRTFNDNLKERLHPKSGVTQQRWFWDVLEPEEGKINFKLIDSVILLATSNGQQLNLRVMCQDVEMRIPKWALDQGVAPPYYDNPVFLQKQENLIKALAVKYDGNPAICFIDIGTVGHWGEWHTEESDTNKVRMPNEANTLKIIDIYCNSFKKTPLVLLIATANSKGMEYGISKGAGWRADCWGDMDTLKWNHMGSRYPKALRTPGATDAWKKAPVALETCWTFEKWFQEGWDIDYILGKALEWHATEVNNGSESIPEKWWDKTLEFEKKLGYRFVLKKITYPSIVRSGGSMELEMDWENKGVAPVYQQYPLVVRLRSAEGNRSFNLTTDVDCREWMPGTSTLKTTVTLPADMPSGKYIAETGLVTMNTFNPAIKLAIEGRTADGWYGLGDLEVVSR